MCIRDSSTAEGGRRASLDGVELKSNWKLRQQDSYQAVIAKIQSYGITVNGCFILGLDGDTRDVFDDVLDFVRDSALYEVQVTFMTAFPGTPLYARLKREGRILDVYKRQVLSINTSSASAVKVAVK